MTALSFRLLRPNEMAKNSQTQHHHGKIADDRDGSCASDVTNLSAMARPDGKVQNQPALFHKVKNERSILALAVSDSRLFAGTQAGEILVSLSRCLRDEALDS